MRAVFRFGKLLLTGALALAPFAALAQEAPPPSNTPATDAVGPKELQNFTLNGTVTRQADQPAVVQPARPRSQPRSEAQKPPQPATERTAPARTANVSPASPRRAETTSAEVPTLRQPEVAVAQALPAPTPSPSVTVPLPKLDAGAATASAASATFPPDPAPAGTLAPEHKLPILPWLLAALALGAGGAFLFWRNRGREAFAGGPRVEEFIAAPAPAPAPRAAPPPQPAPKTPPPAAPSGIVSTRLRPWIEIGFQPLRCILEDQHIIVEFDVELYNSGTAAARSVLVEGTLFSAGATQDAELERFFANPVAEGDRIETIPPLKRASLRTRVVLPRERMLAYEAGGRQVFIPLIAFNALYSWGGGAGQTSVSYLLGRDTKSDKMGPFRVDLGPRIFRGIGARLLPAGVRQ